MSRWCAYYKKIHADTFLLSTRIAVFSIMDIAYEVIFLEAAQIGEKYMPAQKKFRDSIHAKGTEITVLSTGDSNDYISLTDIARYKSDAPDDVIKNWMRNRDTIEFLGLWEQLNNPDFKPVEFDGFRTQAGSNAFTMSPKKWVEATGAIGIVSKAGRYGGTFAQKDIAFEFASWISAEFKLYTAKRTAPAVKCQCQTDDAVAHERPSNRGIQGIRHTAA